MKHAIISITRHGVLLAERIATLLPDAQVYAPRKFAAGGAAPTTRFYDGTTGSQIARLFAEDDTIDAIVAIFSLGALVRMLAPLLESKTSDPAVVVVDEGGRFVIPVLSGHLGGANALAGRLAEALGAQAVLTTASDSRATLAVDLLGRELGWTLEASHEALVLAAAAVVNDEPVAVVQEAGAANWWAHHANGRHGPLPNNLTLFFRLEDVDPQAFSAVLWISRRAMPDAYAKTLDGRCVVYRPGQDNPPGTTVPGIAA